MLAYWWPLKLMEHRPVFDFGLSFPEQVGAIPVTLDFKEFEPIFLPLLLFIAAGTSGDAVAEMVESTLVYRHQMVGVPALRQGVPAVGTLPTEELLHRLATSRRDVFFERGPKDSS